jgi:beta-glucosidase
MSSDAQSARRGPYARGRQSRELILDTALEIIGHKGYNAMSLRDIASAVGMTQAGLLHHFQTKENLLTEVLRRRDVVDHRISGDEHFPRGVYIIRHNVEVRGLIQLYVSLQAAAEDVGHPAHAYFRERMATVQANVAADVRERQADGRFDPSIDAGEFAQMFIALSDGLQLQWCIDPSIDLPGLVQRLWERFATPRESP